MRKPLTNSFYGYILISQLNNCSSVIHNKEKHMDELREECEARVVHLDALDRVREKMPDEDTLLNIAELFKVFGDSTRTRILSALSIEELCVCDISALLNMSMSAVSHQLRILRQTKIVKSRRNGKEIVYSLDDEHISKLYALALAHLSEEE